MTSLSYKERFPRFRGKPPALASGVQNFQQEAGFQLPEDYIQFLQQMNGGEGFIGPNEYLILWSLEDLLKLNRDYAVEEFAPGLFLFGSNGGGDAFAFDGRSTSMPVVNVPFVGMDLNLVRLMAPSFVAFLELLARS